MNYDQAMLVTTPTGPFQDTQVIGDLLPNCAFLTTQKVESKKKSKMDTLHIFSSGTAPGGGLKLSTLYWESVPLTSLRGINNDTIRRVFYS